MTYFHQMLGSKNLGGAELIGVHFARFLRENGQKYCVWIPGKDKLSAKLNSWH